MADTVQVKWIYPPNFGGTMYSLREGPRHIVVNLRGVSDGTGETDVVKIDKSALLFNGAEPSYIVVEKIQWQVYGCNVVLEWNNTTQEEIIRINAGTGDSQVNHGTVDWTAGGGKVPASSAGDGDVILSTTDIQNGDNYDITLYCRLKT